uniref:Uncharacterized protein n=1 Tax=Anguilla anguilla TaxID=7936 RepID=A0A0E9R5V6_ANGAN
MTNRMSGSHVKNFHPKGMGVLSLIYGTRLDVSS